jgi:hypothetical protein
VFNFILSWLTGGFLDKILGLLQERARAAADRHKVDAEAATRIAIQEITAEIEARKAQAAIIRAEQGWWLTALIRPALAMPFVVYVWKVVVYDKVLKLGTTDPLTGDTAIWGGVIIGFYFLVRSAEKIARGRNAAGAK